MARRSFTLAVLWAAVSLSVLGKDAPPQVLVWPESGTPAIRFTFGKFRDVGSFRKAHTYVCDTTAENLSGKPIATAEFALYLYDKDKVRIGDGWISLTNVRPGETIKFQTTVDTTGTPVSISLAVKPPTSVSITVNSIPQGAVLKVDGADAGTTPKMVQIGVGKHLLEFSKEGFNSGKFPLEIGPHDVSGGSVSYELGTSVHDTLELRDGSVLTGDLESISATEVVFRMGGTLQHLNRNQVKRILLVVREMAAP